MKTALITGANQGIGFETAKILAENDYLVYLGSRNIQKGIVAAQKLHACGLPNIIPIELDVCNEISIKKAQEFLTKETKHLDLLINNAAIAGRQSQDLSMDTIAILREVFETNFFGVVQTTQIFLSLLKKSTDPRIINVSSPLGSLTFQMNTTNPNHRIYDAYSSSKTALNAFTVLLARNLEEQVKVISVEPGYTATHLNDYQGAFTPQVAAASIIRFALCTHMPTGKNFDHQGNELPW